MRPRLLWATALTVTLAAGCRHLRERETGACAPDPLAELVRQIDARFDDPGFADANWGVLIQSLDTGRVWYERNADKLFVPASNEKILTTSAALLTLGPDFTFKTYLCHTGEIRGSTLDGDLVVFGNGDPTLYTRFGGQPLDAFREWAAALRDRGIRHVTGDVIGDDNAFDDDHIGSGWSYDGLAAWYSAEFGALMLNEDYVDLTITPPPTVDGQATIASNLPSSYYTVVNRLETVEHGRNRASIHREPNSNEIVLTGTVVAGEASFEESPTITNPTLFYVTVLREVLIGAGIEVQGQARDCDDIPGWQHRPEDFPRLAVRTSPPLADIVHVLLKRSQNLYAETLAHTLGWYRTGLGSFRAGREEVQSQLATFGVAPDTYAYRDGSGLSRYDLVSPRQIVDILRGMRQSRVWEVWRDSLPIAGVDGTIRSRMRGTAAQGNVRAKTGTLSYVRALSGYVTTADGENLVFSTIVNNYLLPTRAAESIQDDVMVMLATFDRGHGSPATELRGDESRFAGN
jgi:D-alanyl-D-alanine carboxypeptidase/D-alanyl-D-alanine-endopeptidase (penicillin-binding protein 4)